MRGQRVCTHHGGRAPQAKDAAAERIKQLAEGPALTRLEALVESRNEAIALGAVKDALDRAGYGAKQTVRHEWAQEAQAIARDFNLPIERVYEMAGIPAPSN